MSSPGSPVRCGSAGTLPAADTRELPVVPSNESAIEDDITTVESPSSSNKSKGKRARTSDDIERSPRMAQFGNTQDVHYEDPPSAEVGENTEDQVRAAPARPARGGRRDSSVIVLPRWQPDAEVTYCPICRSQFSFFIRKHHCRKCGRVVCSACSPHRITIPYQFIVQPSPHSASSRLSLLDGQHIGGGERVRLCNPCVPDPQTLPSAPPPYAAANPNPPRHQRGMSHQVLMSPTMTRDEPGIDSSSARSRSSTISYAQSRSLQSGMNLASPSNDRFRRDSGDSILSASHSLNSSSSRHQRPGNSVIRPYPSLTAGGSQRSTLRTSSNNTPSVQPHYRSLLDLSDAPSQSSSSRDRPLPPIPRVAEEDECPICHNELPSRSLPDFEELRAVHITQCIDAQISRHSGSSPRPGALTSQSQNAVSHTASASASSSTAVNLPSQTRSRNNTASGSSSHMMTAIEALQSSAPEGSFPQRQTRMFPYRATEKDCVDDAECTICLEEFEVGVKMARLECFCRFHRDCIRAWFENHPGRCPVHQHDGHGF